MTINEAIIANMSLHKCLEVDTDPYFLDAIRLGAEALEELEALRLTQIWGEWKPLPGETEE